MAAIHQIYQNSQSVLVFSSCIKTLVEKQSELLEYFGSGPTHNLDIFGWQLEWYVPFNFYSFSRRVADEKAIVDVSD